MHPDELIKFMEHQALNHAIDTLESVGITYAKDMVAYKYMIDKAVNSLEQNQDFDTKIWRKGIRYIDFKSLVPLAHPTLSNFYRVPIKVTKTQYKVYVNKGCTRIFTQATVPPYLLSKLTMAKAASDNTIKDSELYEYDLFVTKDKNGMADVAWRASESMYTIILHDTELNELLGGHL